MTYHSVNCKTDGVMEKEQALDKAKNVPNIGPKLKHKSRKNGALEPPGSAGTLSWGDKGPSSTSGGVLKATRAHQVSPLAWPLGSSWAVLGRKGWPAWLQLGSQNGTKIEKKWKQKTIKILMPLEIVFW